ncbi:hypothetical protein Tco_0299549 [Tanacetum coccineum]
MNDSIISSGRHDIMMLLRRWLQTRSNSRVAASFLSTSWDTLLIAAILGSRDLVDIGGVESYDNLFTLKIHHSGNFTSPPGRIYRCAEIEWYDLVDSERFSINRYDAMLEDLEYVPRYKEIEVYVEKQTMEVVLGKGKGVVIEKIMEDDEVKEASETRNSGKPLLNKRLSEEFQFRKLLFDIDLTFSLDFSHETLEMNNEQEDPINYQHNPYHGEDEAEENAELFDELDHLLEHVPFLKETVVVVDVDAPLLAIDAPVVPPVIVLEE